DRFLTLVMPASRSWSPEKAAMEIGTSWMDSCRLRAVTMISSSTMDWPWARAGPVPISVALAAMMLPASTLRRSRLLFILIVLPWWFTAWARGASRFIKPVVVVWGTLSGGATWAVSGAQGVPGPGFGNTAVP